MTTERKPRGGQPALILSKTLKINVHDEALGFVEGYMVAYGPVKVDLRELTGLLSENFPQIGSEDAVAALLLEAGERMKQRGKRMAKEAGALRKEVEQRRKPKN